MEHPVELWDKTTGRAPVHLCPHCGYAMDSARGVGHRRLPKPGKPSVCLSCGGLLILDADLRGRLPYAGEFEAMCAGQPGLGDTVAGLQAMIRSRPELAALAKRGGRA
jgi:hypothetical protein